MGKKKNPRVYALELEVEGHDGRLDKLETTVEDIDSWTVWAGRSITDHGIRLRELETWINSEIENRQVQVDRLTSQLGTINDLMAAQTERLKKLETALHVQSTDRTRISTLDAENLCRRISKLEADEELPSKAFMKLLAEMIDRQLDP